ncbi:MAG: tetratricopeptide repeat protein [Vulcanimicrobiota bacterium]
MVWRLLFILWLATVPALAKPSYASLKQAGDKALAAKDYKAAIAGFERLAREYPDSSEAHNLLGFACFQSDRTERALYEFREALRYNRNNGEAQHNLILAAGKRATERTAKLEFTEALHMLDEIISNYYWHPQLGAIYYYRGKVLFFRGDEKGGMQAWREAARRTPGSAVGRFLEAFDEQKRGQSQAAGVAYQEALKKVPDEPIFRNYYGLLLEELDKDELALAQYRKALSGGSSPYVDLYLNESRVLRRLGNLDLAVEALVAARNARPDYASIHASLWAAYRALGRSQEAEEELALALSKDPRALIGTFGQPGDNAFCNGEALGPVPAAAFVKAGKVRVEVGLARLETELDADEVTIIENVGGQLTASRQARVGQADGRQPAPGFVLKDRNNKIFRLSTLLYDQPILLMFWSASDSQASSELDEFSGMLTRLGEVSGVAIHVEPEQARAAYRLLLSKPKNFRQLWGEPKIQTLYGIEDQPLPVLVLIDKDGYVAGQTTGPEAILEMEAMFQSR